MSKILVTGALGQIGTELLAGLRAEHGAANVVASDIRGPGDDAAVDGPFELLDVTDGARIAQVVKAHQIDAIYHLAALLSATGEARPQLAWHVNVGGLMAVLEVARESGCRVFTPSSIAAFGPSTPAIDTPQDTLQRPTSMYGVTKVTGELLCDYYHHRYGVDTRGVRFPGLISYGTPPGGGTTDYAVDIFHAALKHGNYACFLGSESRMDMMYMPDAIRGIIQLMNADASKLIHRNAFNITAMSFTPAELAHELQKHLPDFVMSYDVDPVRQAIADSWPDSLDDSTARAEWGWDPTFDMASMVTDMLTNLRPRYS
ncbi:MAG: nucleoside-diphosphate-sugar epimerase [Kiritimatiellia bacterium]|jgi:nucleoside-diphosphate-sugar epimerase